jgi:paraquat-inducible protein B
MPNETGLNELPEATLERKKRRRISVVWIIPILAAVIALGIAIQRAMNEGPTITIAFKAAEGIEAGKTFIKYKDVTIGQVTAVQLSEDYTGVLVTAKIAKHAAALLVEDTKFWVVEPRASLSGVSGLGTLLSGNSIGMQVGKSATRRRSFAGLDVPPTITDQPGRQFLLRAASLGSVGIGAPIYYRSLSVGQVAGYSLAADGKSIDITVFVNSPYDKYVTSRTRFWNASGIDVSAGAEGVKVHTESLVAVLAGGLAFDAPDFLPAGEPAAADTVFTLYPNRAVAMKQPDKLERRFVLYFDESVRGLSVGAPVTFFGLPVGEVAEVGLDFNAETLNFRPRVLITFFPERLVAHVATAGGKSSAQNLVQGDAASRGRMVRRMVEERGLRATLQTGSLLTGEQYVAFQYFPNLPKPKIDWNQDPLELPVSNAGLASLEVKLDSILTKINRMPLEQMGTGVKDLLVTLNQTLKDADAMIKRVDTEFLPEGTKTLEELHHAIADGDRALLGEDSAGRQDLRDALQEMARAARSIRVLVDYLERHPETLIRGKKQEEIP